MKIEAKMFMYLTGFFFVIGVIYLLLNGDDEPVGSVAILLTGGLTLIVGTFLSFSGRRLQTVRPEDDEEAEVSDGAGDLGFFSPGSYWPVTMAFTAAVFAIATAFLLVWLMVIAAAFLIMSICGLLFEYQRAHVQH
ncbi:cytochrome c oxidase subunit 4 [Nakamurella silvestris]|nr:cytochrome c oxidase subunit 4 [Nakamurella silvestris]